MTDHDEATEASTEVAVPDHAEPIEQVTAMSRAELDAVPGWKEMQGLAAMAVTLSAAGAVPRALQGKPNDVFLVLLTARELGIAPTAAIRTAYVVNGAVTLAPKLRAAIVRQQGIGRIWPEKTNNRETATWNATRADEGHERVYSFTFTIEDAQAVPETVGGKKATLADKDNWKGYPQRMLSWRALGYLLDDVFPEVGTGLYSADEVGAVTDDEGHPVIDVAHTDPLPGTSAPRNHTGATPSEPEPPASADDVSALRATIRQIVANPDAKAALVEMWGNSDGVEPLPHVDRLLARQVKRARAIVDSVAARLAKGEWGDAEPAQAGPERPDEAETGEHRAEPVQSPTGDPGPSGGEEADPEEAEVEAITASVAMAPLGEVRKQLRDLNVGDDGSPTEMRNRLATELVRRHLAAKVAAVTGGEA